MEMIDMQLAARPAMASTRCVLRRCTQVSAIALAAVLALAGASREARAQEVILGGSYAATGTVVSGTATILAPPGAHDITVDSSEVVIDWRPTDLASFGTINFQPAGTTATYQTSTSFSGTNFTVLNRIQPVDDAGSPTTRAVQFNGTVRSFIAGSPGGSIWFYSPTGIIVGPTAVFDTGDLLLTTNPIDTSGGLYGASGDTIRFRGAANANGFVTVFPGGTITSLATTDNYVALVAPIVNQAGAINANGQIALVAAEQADITINAGLLNIVVTQGTTDNSGIIHSGTTGGPASDTSADVQRIQMIAIPKNTALTMLLRGNIGYTPAASAANEGSAIVLSAGVADNIPLDTQELGLGSINIGNSVFRNEVTARASNAIDIAPTAGLIDFQANADLTAGRSLSAATAFSETIQFRGALTQLTAQRRTQGGDIDLIATGGQITAQGDLALTANGEDFVRDNGEAGRGGLIDIVADGGAITAVNLVATANGSGQRGDGGAAGAGIGGRIGADTRNNGTITTTSYSATANGVGTGDFRVGGDGFGGSIVLRNESGLLDLGSVDLSASASGGLSPDINGNAMGGTIFIELQAGAQNWNSLFADATARGGQAFTPGSTAGSARGNVDGDSITVILRGTGSLAIDGDMGLLADGITGIDGAPGYIARGGSINVFVGDGNTLQVGSFATAFARGLTDPESYHVDPVSSPFASGGFVRILADNGTIRLVNLDVSTSAITSGALANVGTATGGIANVGAINGGLISIVPSAPEDFARIFATAEGATGPVAANATGGTATLFAEDGALDFQVETQVSGNARDGSFALRQLGAGFDATGGNASVELRAGSSGTGSIAIPNLTVSADGIATGPGTGSEPILGNGGTGTGGTAKIEIAAGTFASQSSVIQANGSGGTSGGSLGTAFLSGLGQGGTASFEISGGTANVTDVSAIAKGIGGGDLDISAETVGLDGNGSIGGLGNGGNASIIASRGVLTANSLTADAQGIGGVGLDAVLVTSGNGGNGGSGIGGTASIVMPADGSAQLTAGTTIADARGIGGNGGLGLINGAGGSGGGGTALFDIHQSGTINPGNASALADGEGGDGGGTPATGQRGNGGSGTGGTGRVSLIGGNLSALAVTASANGTGGAGALVSGSGQGGTAALVVDGGNHELAALNLNANGLGGNIDPALVATGPGTAGDGLGGTASLDVAAGTLRINGDVQAKAKGAGGGSSGPAGIGQIVSQAGNGAGGLAQLTVGDGALTLDGASSTFDASGTGGAGMRNNNTIATETAGSGGTGTGGEALFITRSGNSGLITSFGDLTFLAQGQGGSGGASGIDGFHDGQPGEGIGGTASTQLADGDFQLGNLFIDSSGLSGEGPLANFTVTDPVTGVMTTVALRIVGSTTGGKAAFQLTDSIVAPAGRSISSIFLFDDGSFRPGTEIPVQFAINVLSPDSALVMPGALYAGAFTQNDNGDSFTGSIGGASLITNAFTQIDASGTVVFDVAPGRLLDAGGRLFLSGSQVTTTGLFGAGAGGAYVFGFQGISMTNLASAGTSELLANGGRVTVSELTSTGLVTARGQAIDIRSSGGLSFADLDATDGNVLITTSGDLLAATVDATGRVNLESTTGAVRTTGAVNGVGIDLTAARDVQTDAKVTATGSIEIIAAQGITAAELVSSGSTSLEATDGAIGVTSLSSQGRVNALGRSANIVSSGPLTFGTARATAGDFIVNASGPLTFGAASATGLLSLASITGSLTATGALNGGSINLASNGPLSIASATSVGAFTVDTISTFASSGIIAVGGNTGIVADGGINLSGGSLIVPGLVSGGTTVLQASDGTVIVLNLRSTGLVTARGQRIDIRSSNGGLSFADLDATVSDIAINLDNGDLVVATADAPGAVTLASLTGAVTTTGAVNGGEIFILGRSSIRALGNITATQSATANGRLNFQATNDLTIDGVATGVTIDASSSNIAIGASGRLGTRGQTRTIVLGNGNDNAMTRIGGAAGDGYSIDKLELSRLFADQSITIGSGSEGTPPAFIVGDLALRFGNDTANIGTGGQFKINTAGRVEINGDVVLTTTTNEDTFFIDPTEIFVNGDTGGIVMRNQAGELMGTLDLLADTIIVSTAAIRDELLAATTVAEKTAILDRPSLVTSDGGYLQAANIIAAVNDGIFIQNTGASDAFADRRGFSANSFEIISDSLETQIAINGVIEDATGASVTGLATTPLITINDVAAAAGGEFDPLSTINGCVIGADCAIVEEFPSQNHEEISNNTTPFSFTNPSLTLIEIDEPVGNSLRPLIDEPVTGVGNDDLWQNGCGPEGGTCEGEGEGGGE